MIDREQSGEHPNESRRRLQNQLERLLDETPDLRQFADILGAQQFLTEERGVVSLDVQQLLDDLERRGLRLPDSYEILDDVIITPDEGEIIRGSGEGLREPKTIPRTEYLVELLSELGLSYGIKDGKLRPSMLRKQSYRFFEVPAKDVVVAVCNEEGNVTFVIYRPGDLATDERELHEFSKDELKQLELAGNVRSIRYPGDPQTWKLAVAEALDHQSFVTLQETDEVAGLVDAPVDWLNEPELEVELGKSLEWIRKKLKELELNQSPHKKIMRGRKSGYPSGHYSPEAIALLRSEIKEASGAAPATWPSLVALQKKHDVAREDLRVITRDLRRTHPEQFVQYRHPGTKPQWHVSPELAELIERRLEDLMLVKRDREEHPERPGWLTTTDMSMETKSVSRVSIKRILDILMQALPTDHCMAVSLGSIMYYRRRLFDLADPLAGKGFETKELEYYMREAGVNTNVAVESEEDLERYFAPFLTALNALRDWPRPAAVAAELGISHTALGRRLPEIRAAHPEWFSQGSKPVDTSFERLHPAIITLLRDALGPNAGRTLRDKELFTFAPEELQQAERVPSGWYTLSEFAELVGIKDLYALRREMEERADIIRERRWIRPYRDRTNKPRAHFSTELAALLREQLTKRAPAGWLPTFRIAHLARVRGEQLESFLQEYSQQFPDKAGLFEGSQHVTTMYYDPGVVQWIEQQPRGSEAPSGWKTCKDAAVLLNVDYKRVRRAANRYRATNPEYFDTYRVGQNPSVEHISQELIDILRGRLESA